MSQIVDGARDSGEGDFITPTRDMAPAPSERLAPGGAVIIHISFILPLPERLVASPGILERFDLFSGQCVVLVGVGMVKHLLRRGSPTVP